MRFRPGRVATAPGVNTTSLFAGDEPSGKSGADSSVSSPLKIDSGTSTELTGFAKVHLIRTSEIVPGNTRLSVRVRHNSQQPYTKRRRSQTLELFRLLELC